MNAAEAKRRNLKSSVIGGCAGGFAWIVLLGAVNGSALLLAGGLSLMLIGVLVGLPLAAARPDRRRKLTGLLMLWLAAGNLLVLNLAWDEIPDQALGVSTGKQHLSLPWLNFLLAGAALIGVWLVIKDVTSKGRS